MTTAQHEQLLQDARETSRYEVAPYRPPLDPLLNPFSLQFPCSDQETVYIKSFADSRSRSFDQKAWLICFAVHAMFVLLQGGYQDPLLVAYGAVMVVHGLLVHRLCDSRASASCRLLLITALRLLTDAILAHGMLGWNGSCSMHGWPKHIFISSGIFSLWWQAFFYVLPFKWMLLTQALSVLQYHRGLGAACCTALLASPGGEAAVRTTWHHVAHICGAVSVVGRVDVLEATAMEAITERPQLACLSTTLLLQVLLGYAVPVAMLYALERRERLAFWAAARGHPAAEVVATMRLGVAACGGLGVLVVLVMVCLWENALVLLYNHLLP